MTGKQSNLILSSDTPSQNLPDEFNSFFIDKISKIRAQLDSVDNESSHDDTPFSGTLLTSFDCISIIDLKKTISKCNKSFCELDLLPEFLFN